MLRKSNFHSKPYCYQNKKNLDTSILISNRSALNYKQKLQKQKQSTCLQFIALRNKTRNTSIQICTQANKHHKNKCKQTTHIYKIGHNKTSVRITA